MRKAQLIAFTVLLGVSTPALAQTILAPTSATLPSNAPILVKWVPSGWAGATVDISLESTHVGGLGMLATNVPNIAGAGGGGLPTAQTLVSLPSTLACDPSDTYRIWINVWADAAHSSRNGTGSPLFHLSCQSGSITVVKTVTNTTGKSAPAIYNVGVTCGANAPNTTVALSSTNNFQQSVVGIPSGSHCTITEQAPVAPATCHWTTTYPQGQSIVTANTNYQREVHNELTCLGLGPMTTASGLAVAVKVPEGADTGSIALTKQVVNASTTIPPPDMSFQVQVTCTTAGPNVAVTLSAANHFTQTVSNIPANSKCTIAEQTPVVPRELAARGCSFETTYPEGKDAAIGSPAAALKRTVVNRWSCKEATTGVITFVKQIVNKTAVPTPRGPFPITVDCTPNGPHQILNLTSPGNLQQAVTVPIGTTCTIGESTIDAPRPCHWVTTYPNGQSGKAGSTLVVQNELICTEKSTSGAGGR